MILIKRQQGLAMLEVLYASLVVTVGLLVLVQMQTRVLQTAMQTHQHYMATLLAENMSECIKANRENRLRYDQLDTRHFNKDCDAATCTLIEQELFFWRNTLDQQYPPGLDAAATIAIRDNTATIRVSWLDKLLQGEREIYEIQVAI